MHKFALSIVCNEFSPLHADTKKRHEIAQEKFVGFVVFSAIARKLHKCPLLFSDSFIRFRFLREKRGDIVFGILKK